MKYVLVIPDGAADEPQPGLGGRTPLQAARLPNMDAVAQAGIVGRTDHVPASMPSGSDVGTMSLFGYDPLKYHTGRAPLEAAAQGIPLNDGDWAIRCNLVTVRDGRMISFTAEQIDSDSARELIDLLNRDLPPDSPWKFHPGVSYRNLLTFRAAVAAPPFDRSTETTPPHDVTDQPIADRLPRGPGAEELLALMERSRELLADAPANRRREAAGLAPATQVWLWGLGQRPSLPPFVERFGKRGAVITAVDLLRGLGRLLEWDVIEIPGATGYLDTDYGAKGRGAVERLEKYDLIVVHIEAPDEASHEGNAEEKILALERIDEHIVGPVHAALKQQGEYRLLVCPDHPTFLRTKTHSHGYVPFAVCGSDIPPAGSDSYDEVTAAASGVLIPHGHELMPTFLNGTF